MKKRVFQILDEMNVADGENNTEHVAISNSLIGADKVKQGGKITMGVDDKRFNQILHQMMGGVDNKKIVLLLVVDRKEYEIIENSQINNQ